MKYEKTKYPNIFSYEIKRGKRYRIRRGFFASGIKKEVDESGFKNLVEARARLTEIESMIDKEELGYLTSKTLTCDDYYNEYSLKKTKTGVWSPDTKRSNDTNWKNHVSPTFGHLPMTKLNRNSYEIWISEKLKEYAKSSVKSYHDTFMNMLNDAVTLGILERNRLLRVTIGSSSIQPRNKQFSFELYKKWMSCAQKNLSKYDFTFVYLSVFGLRRGEILGIKKSSVHPHEDMYTKLSINDSRTNEQPNGKGSTKTGKSRWVTVDKLGTELVSYAIQEATEIKKDHGVVLHKDDYLYMNPRTGKPYDVGQLNRLFKTVNEISGLHAYPHLLRHYFTSQSVISGVPKEHAAAVLGHTTIHMTEQYTHIENEVSDKVINLVESRLRFEEN